jgi:hypothetical protein
MESVWVFHHTMRYVQWDGQKEQNNQSKKYYGN